MRQWKLFLRYLNYLQQARNPFDIHPPFVYELVSEVVNDAQMYPEYGPVEELRRELLKNKTLLEINDLGAGSTASAKRMRTVADITRHSSKSRKYGRLLFRLSMHLEPATILELGTAMGISSAYLAFGNRMSEVTTVEGCSNIAGQAQRNLQALGLENVRVINANFDNALPDFLEKNSQLELVFIDGNHREEPTVDYFEQCLSKTVNKTCIVFDDIHWSDGMERAWSHIRQHPRVTASIDLFQLGIVFFRKELSKQHFIIRF